MAASTPGCLRLSRRSVVQCGIFHFSATCFVVSARPPASDTTSMPGIFASASRCLMPKAPWPARQIFMGCLLAVFEDDMAQRRVGNRNVMEAVDFLNPVVERAAHDEPHDELDAFRARLAQILER